MRFSDFGKTWKDEKKVVRNGIILLTFAALLILLLMKFDQVWAGLSTVFNTLSPVLFGIVLAYILNVFVHLFEDFLFKPFEQGRFKLWPKIRRPLAVVLAYLVVALLVVFIACFIIPGLLESLTLLADTAQKTVPGYINSAVAWANDFASKYDLTFIQDFIKSFNWSSLLTDLTKATGDLVASLMNMTFNVANGVFSFLMGFIFSVYMLFGKERLLRSLRATLLAFLPTTLAKKLGRVGSLTNRVFFSFIRGQLTECVILGSLCYVGMSLLGLDYALLISSVVALGALIPILGAYIGAAVGVFILLLVHPIDALIFLVFLLILQQVEGNLIYPRVVGSSIGLPPVWTLFAVLFWGGVMGIPGIIIGTPATAVLYRLLRTSIHLRLKEKNVDLRDPQLAALDPETLQNPE